MRPSPPRRPPMSAPIMSAWCSLGTDREVEGSPVRENRASSTTHNDHWENGRPRRPRSSESGRGHWNVGYPATETPASRQGSLLADLGRERRRRTSIGARPPPPRPSL